MALRRETATRPAAESLPASSACALGAIRTPNLLIRSQMLYPLSYERWGGLLGFSPEAGPRRGRDLNPRTRFSRVNSLAVSPIRPLSHLSRQGSLSGRLEGRGRAERE